MLGLDVVGAGDRDDAEEQEHEHLAEALVAVRARPAGVEHAGEDRRGADEQQLPAGDRDQVDPGQHGDPERDVGRDEHLARRDEPARGDPHRAEPVLGVGAAARVGVVVGEVRPDLDEDRAEQRGDEAQRVEACPRVPASAVPTSTGATAAGSVRGRAAISQMRAALRRRRRAHGRRGNREKSGARFSLYALRPSCASSLT